MGADYEIMGGRLYRRTLLGIVIVFRQIVIAEMRLLCIFIERENYTLSGYNLTPLSRSELILGKTNQITVSPSVAPQACPPRGPRATPPCGHWSSLLSIVVEFVQGMRYFPGIATKDKTGKVHKKI